VGREGDDEGAGAGQGREGVDREEELTMSTRDRDRQRAARIAATKWTDERVDAALAVTASAGAAVLLNLRRVDPEAVAARARARRDRAMDRLHDAARREDARRS
jgi:hypothetical protein